MLVNFKVFSNILSFWSYNVSFSFLTYAIMYYRDSDRRKKIDLEILVKISVCICMYVAQERKILYRLPLHSQKTYELEK